MTPDCHALLIGFVAEVIAMNTLKGALVLERIVHFDMRVCGYFNRHVEKKRIRKFFAVISRLGDGPLWYGLIVLIPVLFGRENIHVSLRMAAAGMSGLIIYKLIKKITERPRPFVKSISIVPGTAPLDQYSFPSGHTLHAVCFTLIAIHYLPGLSWVLVPFAFLVAMSRVVLGLHYPSDVLVGASIGTGLAVVFVSYI